MGRCEDCKWWSHMNFGDKKQTWVGHCHRYPPVGAVRTSPKLEDLKMTWPEVFDNEFCGEFERRKEKQ